MSRNPPLVPEKQPDEEDVLRYLEEARKGAMEAGQFATAIRAAELMGRHLGMFEKKSEPKSPLSVRWAGKDS